MPRCQLCRKNVEELTEHYLCEDCEKQFDFDLNPPYVPDEKEAAKSDFKKVLIPCLGATGLIVFMIFMIPFLANLFGVMN